MNQFPMIEEHLTHRQLSLVQERCYRAVNCPDNSTLDGRHSQFQVIIIVSLIRALVEQQNCLVVVGNFVIELDRIVIFVDVRRQQLLIAII